MELVSCSHTSSLTSRSSGHTMAGRVCSLRALPRHAVMRCSTQTLGGTSLPFIHRPDLSEQPTPRPSARTHSNCRAGAHAVLSGRVSVRQCLNYPSHRRRRFLQHLGQWTRPPDQQNCRWNLLSQVHLHALRLSVRIRARRTGTTPRYRHVICERPVQ